MRPALLPNVAIRKRDRTSAARRSHGNAARRASRSRIAGGEAAEPGVDRLDQATRTIAITVRDRRRGFGHLVGERALDACVAARELCRVDLAWLLEGIERPAESEAIERPVAEPERGLGLDVQHTGRLHRGRLTSSWRRLSVSWSPVM
jgi:hypothetical protein